MAKAGRRLDDLTATLASGLTRRPRTQVETEIAKSPGMPGSGG